jgi:WD40 repeat protein
MGLVTSMQMHPSPSKLFKNLLLTSSLDWTIKLWNLQSSKQPLFQFSSPSYDYVCDVQWSPSNPALFSTISSGGSLALWNLSKSTSEPIESMSMKAVKEYDDISPSVSGTAAVGGAAGSSGASGTASSHAQGPAAALNKSVWSRDGRSILVGDAKGTVHMVSVKEAATKWSSAEEARLELTLLNVKESHLSTSAASATSEAKAADDSFDGSADSGAETEEDD